MAFWAGVALDQACLYYVAILVHGIIFGFFFVGGQVYVDKKAPPEIRAQAQGLIVLICFGIGMLLGTFINVRLVQNYTVDGATNWTPIFMIATLMSAGLVGAFCLVFRDDVTKRVAARAEIQGLGPAEAAKA